MHSLFCSCQVMAVDDFFPKEYIWPLINLSIAAHDHYISVIAKGYEQSPHDPFGDMYY